MSELNRTETNTPRLPRGFSAVATLTKLELLGRARSKKWIAAMIVWVVVLALMWLGILGIYANFGGGDGMSPTEQAATMRNARQWSFALILLFTLGVSLAIAPALASTTINGDRETANLAILQATPITPGALLWGKLTAAWISGAVFVLVGAVPLAILVGMNHLGWAMFVKAIAVMLAEVFFVCAFGIGTSALTSRPVASILATYLLVGGLMIGGPLTFVFTINAMTEKVDYETRTLVYEGKGEPWHASIEPEVAGTDVKNPDVNDDPGWKCRVRKDYETVSHTNRTWWLLMTSPVAILADAAVGSQQQKLAEKDNRYESAGSFTVLDALANGIAQARTAPRNREDIIARVTKVDPPRISIYDECYLDSAGKIHELPVPYSEPWYPGSFTKKYTRYLGNSWYWGFAFHAILAAAALGAAWVRLGVPVKHLPRGVRIA